MLPKIKVTKLKIFEIFFIIFIFVLAFILRTYKIDNPVADWHSWRQADTAAVARNFVKEDFNILYPRAQKNPSVYYNPKRYFLNEFPLYNAVVAIFYKLFGIKERYARLVSIFVSALSAVLLYYLVKQYSSRITAALTALFYAILPYNIYYGRVIMPDPTFILFSILSLYLISLWLEKDNLLLGLSAALSLSLAMLVKPYAIFLGLPIAYLVLRKWGIRVFKRLDVYLMLILAFIPFLLWRYHINQHPEGMFGSEWLINSTNIRFKGSFFRWIIFDRMNRLIFATGGFVLFWLGIIVSRTNKEGLFFLTWLLSVLIYICYFAMGNVTHDYYQMPLVPIGCYFMAKGFVWLLNKGKDTISRIINISLAISFVLLMLGLGWFEVRGYFNINRPEIVEAGLEADKILPKDALVIAPYNDDPAFLYQTNRNGWANLQSIEELKKDINEGATYYISVDKDEMTINLEKDCQILQKTEKYVIIDLQKCNFSYLSFADNL